MEITEKILLYFSKNPEDKEGHAVKNNWNLDNALDLLKKEFPQVIDEITGAYVLDFGCGFGYQSIALVKQRNCRVVGLEIDEKSLGEAKKLAQKYELSNDQVLFADNLPEECIGKFDFVISQNSFEHFQEPEKILQFMSRVIKPMGTILISFGPPWLAPHGSHMSYFCHIPWVNVLFSEKIVMNVRRKFRESDATRYEEAGVNKMTVKRFEKIVASSGLIMKYRKYSCVKGISMLQYLPGLREFFINHITAVIQKKIG